MFRRANPRAKTRVPTADLDTRDDGEDITTDAGIATVTDATFHDDTTGDVALVDFWASWCGPCRAFAPIYHRAASRRSRDGFRFGSCNVDESPESARALGIRSIPTVVAFDRAGNELGRLSGVPSARDLEAFIDKAAAAR